MAQNIFTKLTLVHLRGFSDIRRSLAQNHFILDPILQQIRLYGRLWSRAIHQRRLQSDQLLHDGRSKPAKSERRRHIPQFPVF